MGSRQDSTEHSLILLLRAIVGLRHVQTCPRLTFRYRKGYRSGLGPALAVVTPGSLLEQWRVVESCVAADAIVVMQAANTGLTGGSTPNGDDYDRPVVVVNTLRISAMQIIDGGRQVVCLSGTTLHELESALRPLGREPHSVIGSSCIGASVVGGICNNSGGSLLQRGPAFTQLALFARVNNGGHVELVNHLGIDLGSRPDEILQRLEDRLYRATDIHSDDAASASDRHYVNYVRDVDASTPARFNADRRCLFEASGSAGRVIVFAVRLDTFAAPSATRVFYVGTNDTADLTKLRRDVLGTFRSLPVAAEYIHRTAFNVAERYGKDTFLAIQHLGTKRLPAFFRAKAKIDAAIARIGLGQTGFTDRLLQVASELFPSHLPARMRDYRDRYEHHLLLKVADDGIDELREYLSGPFLTVAGSFLECTAEEADKAFLHRFAVAGAAVRYRAVHAKSVGDLLPLDIALPRDERSWFETLPADLEAAMSQKLYYGHFFCHVFHQDYVLHKGNDADAITRRMLDLFAGRGAECPAEHNVGHMYEAKDALKTFYRELDPCNQLNPGIGRTSKLRRWR